jgi:hypothetical protein
MTEPEKGTNDSRTEIRFLSEYIAPWALSKEEIPVHLVWASDTVFDSIQVLLPPETSLKQLYNVKSFSRSKSEITIQKLHSSNFFGFTLTSKKLIKNLYEKKDIYVNFHKDGKIIKSKHFEANVYRPQLSLAEKPQKIVLTDQSKIGELINLALRISGFGSIEVQTEVSLGGEFQSLIEPKYQEMARRYAAIFRREDFSDVKQPSDKLKSKLRSKMLSDSVKISKLIRTMVDEIKKGNFAFFPKEDIESFKNWAKKRNNAKKISQFLSENIESLILESLLYYFNKYPTEGVALSGGNPSVTVKNAVNNLMIRFRYKDSMLTEYKPVSTQIEIEDLRTNKENELKIPINIKWIHDETNVILQGVEC